MITNEVSQMKASLFALALNELLGAAASKNMLLA
jgi:hypothetical protein